MKNTVYIESLGCEKNLMDSERALGMFVSGGFEVTAEPAKAQVILVNTCGFIASAVEENVSRIVQLSQYKQIGSCEYLILTGCLTQRYSQDLPKAFPEADLFLGTRDYQQISKSLQQIKNHEPLDERVVIQAPAFRKDKGFQNAMEWEDSLPRTPTGLCHTGYLKISEGCNKRCTFCVIPSIRGDLISRPIPSILKEAQMLRSRGLKELHLIAQDLNDYGLDDPNKGKLEDVIETILSQTDIPWIRLHYVYPDRISDHLLKLLSGNPRLCGYLDMPIQHISNRLLKRMGRLYNKTDLMAQLERIYKAIPNLSLRTTVIVGFPGETEKEFQELADFIQEGWVEHLGIFTYFHEPESASFKFEDDIPKKEKFRRKKVLEEVQSRVFEQKVFKKYIGKVHQALIDGEHPETALLLKARLGSQAYGVDASVLINEGEASVGDFVPVRITDFLKGQLVGKIEHLV